jgi:hypothetical protein
MYLSTSKNSNDSLTCLRIVHFRLSLVEWRGNTSSLFKIKPWLNLHRKTRLKKKKSSLKTQKQT